MGDELRRLASPYNELFVETKVQLDMGELSDAEMAHLATQLVSQRISLVESFEPEFNDARDILDEQAFSEIGQAIDELRRYAQALNVNALSETEMTEMHKMSDFIIGQITEVTNSTLVNTGSNLQQNCSR